MPEFVDFLLAHQLTIVAGIVLTAVGCVLLRLLFEDYGRILIRYDHLAEGPWAPRIDWMKEGTAFAVRHKALTALTVVGLAVTGAAIAFDRGVVTQRRPSIVPRDAGLTWPGPICGKPSNGKLMILLHGYTGDASGTWKRFPDLACSDRRLADVDVVAIEYPTYLALRRNLTIAELAHWINENLNTDVRFNRYSKRVIVAHSLGGLVAREMVVARKLSDQPSFGLLVSVATPHRGADAAQLIRIVPNRDTLVNELRPGSSYLISLAKHWEQLRTKPQTVCYSSLADSVVHVDSALAYCDRTVTHPDRWGHVELVKPAGLDDRRYAMPVQQALDYYGSVRAN